MEDGQLGVSARLPRPAPDHLGLDGLEEGLDSGVVKQTYYRWRKQYGGMGVDQLKELKRLQKENERLRRAVSDLTLDKLVLQEVARGNF